VEQLIIHMASENRGYDRIAGAMANLGYVIPIRRWTMFCDGTACHPRRSASARPRVTVHPGEPWTGRPLGHPLSSVETLVEICELLFLHEPTYRAGAWPGLVEGRRRVVQGHAGIGGPAAACLGREQLSRLAAITVELPEANTILHRHAARTGADDGCPCKLTGHAFGEHAAAFHAADGAEPLKHANWGSE
jgi:hypothetical protein